MNKEYINYLHIFQGLIEHQKYFEYLSDLTAEHIEEARLPLRGLVHLVAQLGAVAGEGGHRARRGLHHLLVVRVAHQQHHVLHLVVGLLEPLHLDLRLAEVEDALDGGAAQHLVILEHVGLYLHHAVRVLQHPAPGRLVHVGQFAEGEQCLKVLPIFFA